MATTSIPMTIPQIAGEMEISEQYVHQLIRRFEIPVIKLNARSFLVARKDVVKLKASYRKLNHKHHPRFKKAKG